jgi:hypothetical protein
VAAGVQYVGYDEEKKTLYVQFDGGESYEFYGVPKDVAEGFRWADAVGVSSGRYFHKYIRPRFAGMKR